MNICKTTVYKFVQQPDRIEPAFGGKKRKDIGKEELYTYLCKHVPVFAKTYTLENFNVNFHWMDVDRKYKIFINDLFRAFYKILEMTEEERQIALDAAKVIVNQKTLAIRINNPTSEVEAFIKTKGVEFHNSTNAKDLMNHFYALNLTQKNEFEMRYLGKCYKF